MPKYITDLQVSTKEEEEKKWKDHNFIKIRVALTQGPTEKIYLWYKEGDSSPVTSIQFSCDEATKQGLQGAGFTNTGKDLNEGLGGAKVYLWYNKDPSKSNIGITDLDITTNPTDGAQKMATGWEPVSCEVYWWWWWGNCKLRHTDKWIHLWVMRENPTYIEDVIATNNFSEDENNFKAGYIRLDENINRGTDGEPIFLWYLPTTDPKKAIVDLKVSVNETQFKKYKDQEHYKEVNQDLNEGTGGNQVYLWYKKDKKKKPIQSLILLSNPTAVAPFQTAGVNVINKNLNSGNGSIQILLLAFYQEPEQNSGSVE